MHVPGALLPVRWGAVRERGLSSRGDRGSRVSVGGGGEHGAEEWEPSTALYEVGHSHL